MARVRLRHMVVVLPGITGSVLQKDGRDLWAFSGAAAWSALAHQAQFIQDLRLSAIDDPNLDDLGDGIVATGLMQDATLVPGLIKLFCGYTQLAESIRTRFEVIGNGLHSPEPSNFFEFPFDWRRDNRVSARRLQQMVEQRLAAWRVYTSDPNAKVILLAHSMGGLVARHYLECRDGWRDCLALVSFGTPYRGSLNALRFLTQGYKMAPLDLTDCVRSYTSVYQLLPTYPVVKVNDDFIPVREAGLCHVDSQRANQASQFHAEIDSQVEEHRSNPDYQRNGYKILPFVGTRQPTLQSAVLTAPGLQLSESLPSCVYESLEAGDGTVPRYSAIPQELDFEFRESFTPEKHGALQASGIILDDVLGRLEQMQVPRARAIRGPEIRAEGMAIALSLDDLYELGYPVEVRARLVNTPQNAGKPVGTLSRTDRAAALPVPFEAGPKEWMARIPDLPAGMYRLEVQTEQPYPAGPPPVHDLFEVIE